MPKPEPPFYFDYDFDKYEVASLGIRVRFPAAAPVECSRDYIGNASKEARRFEPSRERKLSRVSAILVDLFYSSVP